MLKMEMALDTLLQDTGDRIADVLEQIDRTKPRDYEGHSFAMNVHVQRLADQLTTIMKFRAEYLGYSPI